MLSDLLDVAAARNPDGEALVDGTSRLSWNAYRSRAAMFATMLAGAGVGPGDRVGVLMPKSVHSFVTVHAIERLGAIAVPVDWFAPQALAVNVLADAGVATIAGSLTGKRLDAVAQLGVAVLDPTGDLDAAEHDRAAADSDDPAYVIYTSGSTGSPKGIVHSHASGLAYARRAATTYGLDGSDRVANIAPLHFDQSTFELYAAPLAGAATIVVPDAVVRFPASLAKLLRDERATVLYTVPYVIEQLVERGGLDGAGLPELRWVKYGGESFGPARLRAAMAALPTATFSNVYGPAEVNQCTFHHVETPPTDDAAIPIGTSWDGVDVLIVDDDGTEIDGDEPGELWVAGPTMMCGYWRRDDLTDAAITRRDGDDRRWYRTGDLVGRGPAGLTFLGRSDNQIKLRGNRIELESIDAALSEHPAVDAGAAFVVGDGDDRRICALVSPEIGDEQVDSLTAHLRRRLAPYALPTEIASTASLARTPTGKIDRHNASIQYLSTIESTTPTTR